MTKNPLINAAVALGYIVLISVIMFYGTEKAGPIDTIIAPIAMLSLFTLSAAVMSYVFFYEPIQLYFAGKKKEGLDLFLKTLATFAVITFAAMLILISGILN